MKNILLACLLAVLMCVCGCAGHLSTLRMGPDETTARIFPISAEIADRLVITAMIRKSPSTLISRVEFPNRGYHMTIRFLIDSHRIVVFYIPAKGRNEAGEIVDGFVFEVAHEGTMARGVKYAHDIFESLIEDATRVAKPIRFVGYQ